MSILAAAAAATAGESPGALPQLAFAAALVAAGLLIARALGAFDPRSVAGPARVQSGAGVVGVLVVLCVGFFVWFGTQIVYFATIRHRLPVNDAGGVDVGALPPLDMAVLATLPFVVGLAALMLGDRVAGAALPRELAWSPRHLPRGIGLGLLAMLSVLPLMFGAGIALELFYQWVGYEHPTEHEMLTVLGRSRDWVTTYLIIGGATLLAPVFEEFLFRGHLQTVLVGAFSPWRRRREIAVLPPLPMAPLNLGAGALAHLTITPLPDRPAPAASPAARWAAIAITSIAFTVLHPTWTWPLIFLLSLALGYAYERTANLWVPVVMHLVFNSVQTTIFLLFRDSL